MAEDQGRESVEHQRSQRVEPAEHTTNEIGLGAVAPEMPALPGSLLGNPSINSNSNTPVRAAVLQRMQSSYGNRAVQRLLHAQRKAAGAGPSASPGKSPAVSVQREASAPLEEEVGPQVQTMRASTVLQREIAPNEVDEQTPVQTMRSGEPIQLKPDMSRIGPQLQRFLSVQRDGPDGGTPAPGTTPGAAAAPGTTPGAAGAAGTTAAAGAAAGGAPIPADLDTFRKHGPWPGAAAGQTIAPSTGMGGFNARYDPVGMVLTITVNIAMTFKDGMTITGNRVTSNDSSLAARATSLNRMLARLPAARRAAALATIKSDWQWSGAADPAITTFMASYKSAVESAWSSSGTRISFQSSKTGWESQTASVNVVVNASNAVAAGAGAAAPAGPTPIHTQGTIFKTPTGNNDFGAAVGPGSAASGTDQTLVLGSSQVAGTNNLLTTQVRFGNNSQTLDSAGRATLRSFIVSFRGVPGGAGTNITITGRANTKGSGTPKGDEANTKVSEGRAKAVEQFLKTTKVGGQGLTNAATRITSVTGAGSTGAEEGPEWRRVDVVVAGGASQVVAAHEFGHMIGLDDEYAIDPGGKISGTGQATGTATGHNALSTSQGMPGSVNENNDNIMSLGNTIKPQHYSTFMEALRTVTGSTEWRVKA